MADKKPRNRRLQRKVRARMAETGENYFKALRAILDAKNPPGGSTLHSEEQD